MEEGSPAASATYYCFDHRATMAAILDMRKYPPHCPRPSTNSPIHPRADSTLQPAAAAAPPFPAFHNSTSLPSKLPPSLLACLRACHPHILTKSGPTSLREPRGCFLSSYFAGAKYFSIFVMCTIFILRSYKIIVLLNHLLLK